MPFVLNNDIVNNQIADAVPVQANYDQIEDYLANHAIADDGLVGMQAPLKLVGDPTQENHAANKGYVDNVLPVGIIFPWPSAALPTGTSGASVWLLCNGQSLSQTQYSELFGVVGLGYGTTVAGEFRLPNLSGRVMVGVTPTVANGGKLEFDTPGKQGGQYTVPLPQHHHAFSHTHDIDHNHANVVSGNARESMTHEHSIDHSHGSHDHDFSYVATQQDDGGAGARIVGYVGGGLHAQVGGSGSIVFDGLSGSGNLTQVHTHNVDLPPFTGTSQNTNTAGHVTTDTGVTQTGGGVVEHLFPYVTINFIIRAV